MSLQDLTYNEVRIRQGSHFQQLPNFVVAAEELRDGQFVRYADDKYYKVVDMTEQATHFVKRAGVARNSITEISTLIGKVQAGEPVMAFTGSGTATIPFATNVSTGDMLTVLNGYAVKFEAEYMGQGYLIGRATSDVTIPEGETLAWGEAWINLPASL